MARVQRADVGRHASERAVAGRDGVPTSFARGAGSPARRSAGIDTVERQLDIFATEHADDLREIAEARQRWRRSDVANAEEAFGDEQDRVEWAAEEVEKMADAYALTLDEDAAIAYRAALLEAAAQALPADRRCAAGGARR